METTMMMTPTLFFSGRAEEALEHYAAVFGGTTEIQRFAGSPAGDVMPLEFGNHVLYGTVTSPLGTIAAMDAPPGRGGTPGDTFAISIELEDETRAAEMFMKLADGGSIQMPWEGTFFAKKFGMTSDKFGVKWMVRVIEPVVA